MMCELDLTASRPTLMNRIAQYIEPLLKECHGKPAASKHIAIVAHGIFNSEFVGALLARLHGARQIGWRYRGEWTMR
jgi:broad specificity phosphatase PhoE